MKNIAAPAVAKSRRQLKLNLYSPFSIGEKMKSLLKALVVQILFVTAAGNAFAATVVCSGTVEELAYHQPGLLMVRLNSMNAPVFICSTDAEWIVPGTLSGNTSVAACKAHYAAFLAARMTKATINSLYFDGDGMPASCTSFASWSKANVRFYSY